MASIDGLIFQGGFDNPVLDINPSLGGRIEVNSLSLRSEHSAQYLFDTRIEKLGRKNDGGLGFYAVN